MTDLSGDYDPQDQSEAFDEDNYNLDDAGGPGNEMRTFEEMPDVYDATAAIGDADDDAGLIGDELDDDEIIDLEADSDLADYEEDDLAARMPEALDDDVLSLEDIEEVGYDGEMNREERLDTGLHFAGDEDDDLNDAEAPSDEARLEFTDDLDAIRSRGTASRMEASRELSEDDLRDLGYRDENGPR